MQVSVGPEGLTARAISPRHILSFAFGSLEEGFPADRIAGPPRLDQGLYDVSASGQGWQYELKRLICNQFHWTIQLGMSTAGSGYYLFVNDADAQANRDEEVLRYLLQKQQG